MNQMLTLLLCLYGIWILPLVFVVRLFYQPVDLSMREHALAPVHHHADAAFVFKIG